MCFHVVGEVGSGQEMDWGRSRLVFVMQLIRHVVSVRADICVEVSDLGDDGNGTRCVFVSASRFGYGSLVGGKRVGLQ